MAFEARPEDVVRVEGILAGCAAASATVTAWPTTLSSRESGENPLKVGHFFAKVAAPVRATSSLQETTPRNRTAPQTITRGRRRARMRRGPGVVLRRAGEAATRFKMPAEVVSPTRSRLLKCCLIGPTNAGKSTLLNGLLDSRVSTVSPLIHTTRVNTIGYLTDDETKTQVEFIDAPGSLGPDVPALHREVWDAVTAAQMALIVVDSSDRLAQRNVVSFLGKLERELAQLDVDAPGSRPQTALVLNKVDKVREKERLLGTSAMLHDAFPFDWPPFMISAKTGSGVPVLRDWLLLASKPGEWRAPQGVSHVQPPLVRATEIIREQLFGFLKQELPYLVEQRNLAWTELEHPPNALRIDQQILVPRAKKSALRIVQGRLPGIAEKARAELRKEFGRVVFLHLQVATVADEGAEASMEDLSSTELGGFSKTLLDRGRR